MAGRVAAAIIEARKRELDRVNSAFTGYHLQLGPPVSEIPRSGCLKPIDNDGCGSSRKLDEETGIAPGRLQQVSLLPDWPEDMPNEDEQLSGRSAPLPQAQGLIRGHSGPLLLPSITTNKNQSKVLNKSTAMRPQFEDSAQRKVTRTLEVPEHRRTQESDRSTNTSFSHHEDSPYTTPCDTPTYDVSSCERSPKGPLDESWPSSACETPKEDRTNNKSKSWKGLLKTAAWSRLKVIGHKAQGRLLQRVSPISSSEASPSSPKSSKSTPSFRSRKHKEQPKLLALLPAPSPDASAVQAPVTPASALGILEQWEQMMQRDSSNRRTASNMSDLSLESFQTNTQTDSAELRKITASRATSAAAPTPTSSPHHQDSRKCATEEDADSDDGCSNRSCAEPAEALSKPVLVVPIPPLLRWSQPLSGGKSSGNEAARLRVKSEELKVRDRPGEDSDSGESDCCGVTPRELSHQLLQLQRRKQRFQDRGLRIRVGEGSESATSAAEGGYRTGQWEAPELSALCANEVEDAEKSGEETDSGKLDLVDRRVAVPRFQWEIAGRDGEVEGKVAQETVQDENPHKKSLSWSAMDVQDLELQHTRASSCPSNLLSPNAEAVESLLDKARSRQSSSSSSSAPERRRPMFFSPGHSRAKSVKSASELWAENSTSSIESGHPSTQDDSCAGDEKEKSPKAAPIMMRSPSPQAGPGMNAEEAYLHLPKKEDCEVLREVIELVVKEMEEEGLPFQGLNRSVTGQSSETATADNDKPPAEEAAGSDTGSGATVDSAPADEKAAQDVNSEPEASAVAEGQAVEPEHQTEEETAKEVVSSVRLEGVHRQDEDTAKAAMEGQGECSVREESGKGSVSEGFAVAPVLSMDVVCGLSDSEGEDASGSDTRKRSVAVVAVSGKDDAADFWGVHPEKLSPVVDEDWRGLLKLLDNRNGQGMDGGGGGGLARAADNDDDDDGASKTSSEGGLAYPTDVEKSDAESLCVNPGSPRSSSLAIPISIRAPHVASSPSSSRSRQQSYAGSSRPLASPFHSRSSSHSYGAIADPPPTQECARKDGGVAPPSLSKRSSTSQQRYVRTLSHSFDVGIGSPRECQGRSSYEKELDLKAKAALEREREYLMRVSYRLPSSPSYTSQRTSMQVWQSQAKGTSPGRWSGSPSRGPRRYGSPSYGSGSGGTISENSRPSSPVCNLRPSSQSRSSSSQSRSSWSPGPGSASPSRCGGGGCWEGHQRTSPEVNSMHMSGGRLLGGGRRVHASNYDYPQGHAYADSFQSQQGSAKPAHSRRVSFDMGPPTMRRSLSVDGRPSKNVDASENKWWPDHNVEMGAQNGNGSRTFGSFCRSQGERGLYNMGGKMSVSMSGERFYPGQRTVW